VTKPTAAVATTASARSFAESVPSSSMTRPAEPVTRYRDARLTGRPRKSAYEPRLSTANSAGAAAADMSSGPSKSAKSGNPTTVTRAARRR
jgi:hypothetical protein